MTQTAVIILAAGKGTRMKSDLPKVLHKLAAKPMVGHVLDAVKALAPAKTCVVVGHGAELVEGYVREVLPDAVCVQQGEQKGTGHAVQVCKDTLAGFKGDVLVVYGDAPLLRREDLVPLVEKHRKAVAAVSVLTTRVAEPFGFGRIVRDAAGDLLKSVEEKEASDDERAIDEVNTGIFCVAAEVLWELLDEVKPSAVKGEYYLTDILELAKARGLKVQGVESDGGWGLLGVNDKEQLAAAEQVWQVRARKKWLAEGVGMKDPHSIWLSHDTVLAEGVELEPHVVFGEGVVVGRGTQIMAFSHLENCTVGEDCRIGPFARLRPHAVLAEGVHVGNFVEVKNATLGKGVKSGHLTYLGDCDVGEGTNVGAGTIVANYAHHARRKSRSSVGANVSLGAGTILVSPVCVGDNVTTGANTTVRKDVESDALVVTRGEDVVRPGYFRK